MGECEDLELAVACWQCAIHPATISVATTRITAMNQGKVSPVIRAVRSRIFGTVPRRFP